MILSDEVFDGPQTLPKVAELRKLLRLFTEASFTVTSECFLLCLLKVSR